MTAALQAGRKHQLPHLFFTILPVFNAWASHFWWLLPSSPWGGSPESLPPPYALLTATSLSFQNNIETTGRGKSMTGDELLPGLLVASADLAAHIAQCFLKQQNVWKVTGS